MTRRWLFLAALLVVAGCNTPQSRIDKNPDLYNSLAPEAQEKIKNGQVDVGYTAEMTEMALGKPDRKYFRKSAAGDIQVWSYVSYSTHTERQRIRADFHVRDASGTSHTVDDWVWVDVQQRTEYDRVRVEFDGEGKVTAIENVER